MKISVHGNKNRKGNEGYAILFSLYLVIVFSFLLCSALSLADAKYRLIEKKSASFYSELEQSDCESGREK